jgi:hypothetical protein
MFGEGSEAGTPAGQAAEQGWADLEAGRRDLEGAFAVSALSV